MEVSTATLPPLGEGLIDPTLEWLQEEVRIAKLFLEAQPGYRKISSAIDAVMSEDEGVSLDEKARLSQTRTNRVSVICENLAAAMTDTKPFWDYTVANRRFEQHAQVYGKLATSWYQMNSADLRLADMIKYSCVAGTGYLHLYWDSETQDMACRALDPRLVLPIRPVNYNSCESCLGIVIVDKVPVNYIRDRYGIEVEAESGESMFSWMKSAASSAADILSPLIRWAKPDAPDRKDKPHIPTATLHTCFLKDSRVNKKSVPVEVGQFHADGLSRRVPSNNWSYIAGPGEPLYPNRRMIVWVGRNIVYDGPSFLWHGRFPVIKFTPNPYPWSWLGKAPLWDLLRLQSSTNRLLRVIDDHAAQVAQPMVVMDKQSVSKAAYDEFSSRAPGAKIHSNLASGKMGILVVNPPPLDASIPAQIKFNLDEMDTLAGVKDLNQLLHLNQLPSNSTIEAILNAMTPALRARSRNLESFMREFAMQLAYGFTQFYTMPRRVLILGPSGVVQDDFDFDPGSLMPDFVHDKDWDDKGISPDAIMRGPLPRFDRAREFMRRFVFKISPGSLLNAAQMEDKLIYLQLTRAGWMDIFTLWEKLGVPNTGVLPDNVRTIPERLLYQATLGLGGNVNPAGRKASGQEPPRVVAKESQ